MIWMRNAIAPVVGSSIYSNWLNGKQQYYIARLAQNVDMENPLAASAFVRTARVGQTGGKGADEAQILVITTMKAQVAKQATISAMKDITGGTVMLLAGAIALTVLLPYAKNDTT